MTLVRLLFAFMPYIKPLPTYLRRATAELFINSLEEAMCTVSKYDAAAWFYQHGLVTLSNVSNLSSLSKGSGKSALSNIHTW